MEKFITKTRIAKTIKTESQTLLGGARNLKVGDWVKFTAIGRISKATTSLANMNLVCDVEIKKDTYSATHQTVNEEYYLCAKCYVDYGTASEAETCFNSHSKSRNTKKAAK